MLSVRFIHSINPKPYSIPATTTHPPTPYVFNNPKTLKPRFPKPKHNPLTVRSVLQWNRKPQLAGDTPRVVNRVNYTAVEVLNGDCRLDQALVRDKRWSNFELLCISKPRSKLPIGFGGKALVWLVDALKSRQEGCPDFIIIDCPAGIDAGFITAITPANEAILVTTPDITSLRDADRVTGLLECDGIRDIKMIVNRVRTDMIKGEDMMSVLDVQEMLGLALLGVIPEDSEVIRSTNRGYPLVLNKPPTLAGLAFEQAAWRLVEQDSMKAVMVEEEPKKRGFFSFFGG
ncbi:ATP binding protein MinD, bacterial-type [Parasponia andersonii]|uniref:ATP binding protein MinD, bacterial-type n=1 Tax=Parasponia andersonii TaxID=3476 RepID=A0A2P5CB21_PARAD|nr:ATP binding protein MinD, bacterial-type [Parasponia andersonii]